MSIGELTVELQQAAEVNSWSYQLIILFNYL